METHSAITTYYFIGLVLLLLPLFVSPFSLFLQSTPGSLSGKICSHIVYNAYSNLNSSRP